MLTDTEKILVFIAKHDIHDWLWWRCDGNYAPVTFFINCNDLFWWGTADCEPFTVADIPDMDKAIADVKAAGGLEGFYGPELWVCRKRGMRPQTPAYPKREDEHLRPLFDACGPERSPEDEG